MDRIFILSWNGELSVRVLLYAYKYNYNTMMDMTYYSYFDFEKSYFIRVRLVKKEEGEGGIKENEMGMLLLCEEISYIKLGSHHPKRVVLFA